MTQKQIKQFEDLVKPLMKLLCDNFNPHTKIIIEPTNAEIVSGEYSFSTNEFLID